MSYDLSNVKSDYTLLDKGDYEVIVDLIEIKTASTGTEYINITYKVRDDVEQEFKGRLIFETIFKEKGTEFFNRVRLTKLIKATHPENAPLQFESIDEILESIVGKKLVVNVNSKYDEYMDADKNYVAFYKPTENGDKVLTKSQPENKDETKKTFGSVAGQPKIKESIKVETVNAEPVDKKKVTKDADDDEFYETTIIINEEDLPF